MDSEKRSFHENPTHVAAGGNARSAPFSGSPTSESLYQNKKAFPRQFQPPRCKSTPSKKGLATSNMQFLHRITQTSPLPPSLFEGCRFAFWRLKFSWGCFFEKGGAKRGALCVSPSSSCQTKSPPHSDFQKNYKIHFL